MKHWTAAGMEYYNALFYMIMDAKYQPEILACYPLFYYYTADSLRCMHMHTSCMSCSSESYHSRTLNKFTEELETCNIVRLVHELNHTYTSEYKIIVLYPLRMLTLLYEFGILEAVRSINLTHFNFVFNPDEDQRNWSKRKHHCVFVCAIMTKIRSKKIKAPVGAT